MYVNLAVFLVMAALVFMVGYFIMQYTQSAAAQEEEEDTEPPIIHSVQIEDVNATSTVITWKTNEEADSLINYGLDKDYGVVRDPRADKVEHTIVLDNLLSDTDYFFRITSSDAEGNQGISSDFTFRTPKKPSDDFDKPGLAEYIIKDGVGGLSQEGIEAVLQAIEAVETEEVLEKIQEKVQKKAEEIVKPPTIILDYADVEVGTDWAIITWETDKEANSMVALAEDGDYDPNAADPYVWREGDPNELVLEHRVEVNGLRPATEYHFQVSSEGTLGLTGQSSDKMFKTKSILPEISNIQIVKVQEEAATIRWTTNVPCSSIVEYTNLTTNETKLEGNSAFLTAHSMTLTNLVFDTYYSAIIRVESEDEEKAESDALTFITIKDEEPPVISKVTTDSTLYPGTENKIQTIAAWNTDEAASCQLFYHQGLVTVDEPQSLLKEEDYGTEHVQVITNFLPSTVYKFWIICDDEAGNVAQSDDFTMLTPTQEESIIDIIIKNFESSFGWVKQIGG